MGLELRAPILEPLLDPLFLTILGGFVKPPSFWQIRLRHVSAGVIMAIAITRRFARHVGILQIRGHSQRSSGFDVLQGGPERGIAPVAFGSGCQIDGGMRQCDATFRHPDKIKRLLRGHSDHQRLRIREPDVLTGGNDETPGNKTRVLAGMDHFGQPVNGGIRVTAANALNEGAGRVVMRIAISIVDHRLFLH